MFGENHVENTISIRNKKSKLKKILSYKYFYIMLIPVIAWYIIFAYVPMYGLVMAFQDFSPVKGYFGSSFIGLENFRRLFIDDYRFWIVFKNTVLIAVYRMLISFPIPIILAILMNEISKTWYRKTVQTIIYLPHFMSWVIVASLVLTIFGPETGIIPALFANFGIDANNLLYDPTKFRSLLVWSDVWKESGWSTIIYVAAMGSIDPNLYEAAMIDGAGRYKQIWHITLPGIRKIIAVMLILMVGQVLNWGFDQVFNLYNPLVYETGDIVGTYIYRTAMADGDFSYGATVGLFQSVLCTVLLIVTNYITKLMGEEGVY